MKNIKSITLALVLAMGLNSIATFAHDDADDSHIYYEDKPHHHHYHYETHENEVKAVNDDNSSSNNERRGHRSPDGHSHYIEPEEVTVEPVEEIKYTPEVVEAVEEPAPIKEVDPLYHQHDERRGHRSPDGHSHYVEPVQEVQQVEVEPLVLEPVKAVEDIPKVEKDLQPVEEIDSLYHEHERRGHRSAFGHSHEVPLAAWTEVDEINYSSREFPSKEVEHIHAHTHAVPAAPHNNLVFCGGSRERG